MQGPVGEVGRWAVLQGDEARAVIGFFGRLVTVLGKAFSRPRALRPSSLARHIYETGITAIPIVSLIAFLISVIVAYLGSRQLGRFGADIFVVDLVTISVLREMGVLLTAIIVALSLQGITGLLFIDLEQDRKVTGPGVLADGLHYPVIGSAPSDFDVLLSNLPQLTTHLVELVDRFNQVFSDANVGSVKATLDNAQLASEGLPGTRSRKCKELPPTCAASRRTRRPTSNPPWRTSGRSRTI